MDKVHSFALRSTFAFMICWVPFVTYCLVKYCNLFNGWKNILHLEYSLFVLALFNSVIDPILYFLSVFSRMRCRNNKINIVNSATRKSIHTVSSNMTLRN